MMASLGKGSIHRWWARGAAVALMLLAAACGGSGDSTSTSGGSGGSGGGGSGGSGGGGSGGSGRVSILTHHYDNGRSGWNPSEAVLTPTAVAGATFGLLHSVALDDQVDAQPLVVAGLTTVGGQATNGHDVVYVTTENNTVYAIDAVTGAVLVSRNLGPPAQVLGSCKQGGPNLGINSTGVIDPTSNTLYVIAYTQDTTGPTYRIHALNVATLQDTVTPPVVTASHTLSDGSTFAFNAAHQRQRPALLLANNTVYAGFGSFCDSAVNLSRGWVLGWTAGTLAPLAANRLTNASTGSDYYLSSVWMSGAGLAADATGVYAVTGNSKPDGSTYDAAGGTNYAESLIKMSPDLSTVSDWFTPANYLALEAGDLDFGGGGVLLAPGTFQRGGSSISLAVAAGKDGQMYVLNTGALGHGGPAAAASPAPIAAVAIGHCWCAESYYVGTYGPTIVSSGASVVNGAGRASESVALWTLPSSLPSSGSPLTLTALSPDLCCTNQNPSFFTSVSSSGAAGVVIWAVTRPSGTTPDSTGGYPMTLWAFAETQTGGALTKLAQLVGGEWGPSSLGGNANTVPVVANGQVYVASYKLLKIFGLS